MDKVSFNIRDIANDTITHVNGNALGTPVLASTFACNNSGDYWIEKSKRGNLYLCTNLPTFTDQTLTISGAQSAVYTVKAVDFVGGRPNDR